MTAQEPLSTHSPTLQHLYSYHTEIQQQILRTCYSPDACFLSPLLRTQGTEAIRQVLMVWKALNKDPPTIDRICCNDQSCVVFMTQHVHPRLFPFLNVCLPVIVTLYFRSTGSSFKVVRHEEHWTVQGLVETVPWFAQWYHRYVRCVTGKLISIAGHALSTADHTLQQMQERNNELEESRLALACYNKQRHIALALSLADNKPQGL
ncbi:hypothetical protein BDF14DRAFT_1006833 [Spinellus fusiger]|nr:hypothetical protein BDF14DRAFT_1006833 [Spinellus fusiger]